METKLQLITSQPTVPAASPMLVNLVHLMRISFPGGERKGVGGVNTPVTWLLHWTKGNLVGPSLVGRMTGKMLKVSLQTHSEPSGGWSGLTLGAKGEYI